jgi:hypothetical protein
MEFTHLQLCFIHDIINKELSLAEPNSNNKLINVLSNMIQNEKKLIENGNFDIDDDPQLDTNLAESILEIFNSNND